MHPVRTEPDLRARVWGGRRLTPPGAQPIGEAWLVGPDSIVAEGPAQGTSLQRLAQAHGAALTGSDAPAADSFPLLIKLLDPADWLSVQVHPDDAMAVQLEGPGSIGKTEAWYVIEARPGAEVLLGLRDGLSPDEVRQAIRRGAVAALLEHRPAVAGGAYLVPAGTLHAVGPGSLIYEIQQPSDITYRCDDWGRPASSGRVLHIEQTLACVQVTPTTGLDTRTIGPLPQGVLVRSDHFVLEYLRPRPGQPLACDPGGASVHVLTAARGAALVRGSRWLARLAPLEAIVVPASAGPYWVVTEGEEALDPEPAVILLARLPDALDR